MKPSQSPHWPAVYRPTVSPRATSHSKTNRLAIHLTIHTLERMVTELLPFYGENCPIAVAFDDSGPEIEVFQGTLATLAGYASVASGKRPMRVVVG